MLTIQSRKQHATSTTEFKSKKENLEDIFENTEDAVEEVLEGTDEEEKKEEE